MGNIFNNDFSDFIEALNNNGVSYILVGGYSVILHRYSRTTGDMDIWVKKDEENYHRLAKAFREPSLSKLQLKPHKNYNFNGVMKFGGNSSEIVIKKERISFFKRMRFK